MEDEVSNRRFYAVRLEDDIPRPGQGQLIPPSCKPRQSAVAVASPARHNLRQYGQFLVLPLVAGLFGLAAWLGVSSGAGQNYAAIPESVTNLAPIETLPPLNYGVKLELASPLYFAETRDALIESETTFVEVDLSAMQLRFFEAGVLRLSAPVLRKGEPGSWWQTPSGLYKVEDKKENYFSSVGQMYQPWAITFEGNLIIHGWPTLDKEGEEVPSDFTAGGIRLETDKAKELYELLPVGAPILVHSVNSAASDFVYEPKIPELKTPHYLIADVESSTVLASSDLEVAAPIASVTKLMTAVIAAEEINLDSTIAVTEPTFVQSLIPRLGERSKVSMYSLLQLLLVESSNEAAEIIASKLGRDEYVALMNAKARELGMMNTHFADASGLSAENTSSLGDLLRLTQYIYTSRSFIFEITANQHTKAAHIGDEFGELVNFNQVEDLDNFIGGKVGETIAAGQTSVTLHKIAVKGEERVVAIIILGSENRNQDVSELLRYAEERFGG